MFTLPPARIVELTVVLGCAVCARGAWGVVIFLPGVLYACGLGVPFVVCASFCWSTFGLIMLALLASPLSVSVGVWMFGFMVCVGGVGLSLSLSLSLFPYQNDYGHCRPIRKVWSGSASGSAGDSARVRSVLRACPA